MKPLLLLVCLSITLPAQKTAKSVSDNWMLTFDDEFNGPELDLAKWVPHDPFGIVRDRQLQAYVPEAVTVSGGQLHIAARRVAAGETPVKYDGRDREYISGIITTFGQFAQTYGRFEIRFRVPAGKGLRPGFLLFPIPSGTLPELDVFETTGSAPSQIFLTNRWGTEQTERSFADSFTVPDLSNGFHTVTMDWERDRIVWSVDGRKIFESTDGVPHQPMYLLIDLAVGGRLAQAPDAGTPLPASFDVDYVRVYQQRQ